MYSYILVLFLQDIHTFIQSAWWFHFIMHTLLWVYGLDPDECSWDNHGLDPDATEMVISVTFIWVQAVAHLLLPWFIVTPHFQSSSLAKHEHNIHFVNAYFCQKGVDLWYIHVLLDELGKYSCTIDKLQLLGGVCAIIHALLQPWVHKGSNLYYGKCGRWYWPRSYDRGDPSWAKSASSFFPNILLCLSILDLRSVCMHAPSCPDRGTQVHQIEDVEGDAWRLKGPMAKVDWGSRATDCLIGC